VASPLNSSTWSGTFNANIQFTGSALLPGGNVVLLLRNIANSTILFEWILSSSLVSSGGWLNVTLPNVCINSSYQSFVSYLTCGTYPIVEDPAHIPFGTYSLSVSVANVYSISAQATVPDIVFQSLANLTNSSSSSSSSCTNITVNTTQYVYVNSSSAAPLAPSVVVDDSNCTITWYGLNDYVWLIIFLIIEAVVFLVTLLLLWLFGVLKFCGSSYSKLG
jgi:hypothetical protein